VTELEDLLGPTGEDVPREPIQSEYAAAGGNERTCEWPGCNETFVIGHRYFEQKRKYCDDHRTPRKGAGGTDRAPGSIKIQLGAGAPRGSKKDAELEKVEERAKQLVELIATLILVAGQVEDSTDLIKGAPAFARATKDLAQYEEWLRKLAQGGDTAGRATAWMGFIVATLAMLLPILLRHGALPKNIADLARQVLQTPPPAPETAPSDERQAA